MLKLSAVLWDIELQAVMVDLLERPAAPEVALLSWVQLLQLLPLQGPGQLQEPGLVQALGQGLFRGQVLGLMKRLHTWIMEYHMAVLA